MKDNNNGLYRLQQLQIYLGPKYKLENNQWWALVCSTHGYSTRKLKFHMMYPTKVIKSIVDKCELILSCFEVDIVVLCCVVVSKTMAKSNGSISLGNFSSDSTF